MKPRQPDLFGHSNRAPDIDPMVTIPLTYVRETERALVFTKDGLGEERAIPKAWITEDPINHGFYTLKRSYAMERKWL